jgi:hypothetical protein
MGGMVRRKTTCYMHNLPALAFLFVEMITYLILPSLSTYLLYVPNTTVLIHILVVSILLEESEYCETYG